ncbi:hypothetical protein [Isoptericola sp. 178]|uniref:hypothetical protein n=1 Tax=Isoptericola sp. 178 TaxID=3064651 RepID=UPI002713F9CD|nr:hypothetical protein [Isoptericola sp. 178]MDO8145429.1 hypothetical protein [Isoptericola sp. 178]
MTTLAPDAVPPLAPAARRPVPLTRLVDVELRKLVDTRASRWLLAAVPLLTLLTAVALAVWGPDTEVTFGAYTATSLMPLELLLPLVAVLSVAGEWSQRSALTTFALLPRRGRVMAAKAVALLLVTLTAAASVVLLSAVATVVAAQARGLDAVWDLSTTLTLRSVLAYAAAVAFGFTTAVALRSTAPAMVACLGFLFVVPMVSSVVAGVSGWWAEHGAWVDLSWSLSFLTLPGITGEQWAQVGTGALLWIALPLVLGLRRLHRVEVR